MNAATTNRPREAFTLIELMLVVAIMGVAMLFSYPMFAKLIHRQPLSQATQDIMDACRKARGLAILKGVPYELRIMPEDGHIEVMPAPVDVDSSATVASSTVAPVQQVYIADDKPKNSAGGFSADMSKDVRIQMIDVNFYDFTQADMARVRFFPNGTADEFTINLSSEGDYREVSVEAVTALANVESDYTKFGKSR